MAIDRSKSDPDAKDATAAAPDQKFFAEPVGEMSGELEVEALDVPKIPWDPNLTMPIREGKLNFEDVHPYAVNLRDGKVTFGNYGIDLFPKDIPKYPGMHPEQGKYGVFDFREFVEGLLNDPKAPPDPNATPSDPSIAGKFNFGGHLKLGKGRIGVDTNKSGNLRRFWRARDETATTTRSTFPEHVGKEVEVNIKRRAKRGDSGERLSVRQTGEATSTASRSGNRSGGMSTSPTVHVKEGKVPTSSSAT